MIYSNDLYYCQWDGLINGFITKKIFGIRAVNSINFSPAVIPYIKASNYESKYIQVLVDNILYDGLCWVTICKHQIKNCIMEIGNE